MHRPFHRSMLRDRPHSFAVGAIAIFLTILGLSFAQSHADASTSRLLFGTDPTGGTIPGGTIPPGTIPPGTGPIFHGLINVIHAAPIDSDINNTAIDICDAESSSKVGGPLVYGEQTGYEEIALGDYMWFVAPAGTDCGSNLHDISPFPIYAGTTLSVVIYGGANGYPLTSVVIAGAEGQRIQFLPIMQYVP